MYGQERQRLRELGLTLPPDIVIEVVRRLEGHASLYSISEGPGRIVAKGTGRKIRDLWKEVKLGFLIEVPPEKQAVELSAEAARVVEPSGPLVLGWNTTVADYAAIMKEMPSVDWSIRGLEASGFTSEEALGFLLEYDSLNPDRIRTAFLDWALQDAPDTSHHSLYLQFQHFVQLHFLVAFKRSYPNAPSNFLQWAARLLAEGLVARRALLTKVAGDILRYEIWRTKEHVAAFWKAQEPIGRRAIRQLEKELQQLEQTIAQEVQQQENTNERQLTATE